MERRRSVFVSVLVGFLAAGCLVSGVVTLARDGRDSEFNPWVVGFGGSLAFVVCAWMTALSARELRRAWQLRLFGDDTWAVLADKEYRLDGDSDIRWTAYVEGPFFREPVDTGLLDPGPVGEHVLVRRHTGSGQVELTAARPGPLGDVLRIFTLLVLAASTTAIGFGLVRGAGALLDT
jgi:hypothetical protein